VSSSPSASPTESPTPDPSVLATMFPSGGPQTGAGGTAPRPHPGAVAAGLSALGSAVAGAVLFLRRRRSRV
jgi:hypothetical protein